MKIAAVNLNTTDTNFQGKFVKNKTLLRGLEEASGEDLIKFRENLSRIKSVKDGITYKLNDTEVIYFDGGKTQEIHLDAIYSKKQKEPVNISKLTEQFTYPMGKQAGSLYEDLIKKLNEVLSKAYPESKESLVNKAKTLKEIEKLLS